MPEFKILEIQNPDIKLLEGKKILNSRFWKAKILILRFWTAKVMNTTFWTTKILNSTQDFGMPQP